MISASGMSAQQLALDNISNNLANVNTTGFKASKARFADIYYQKIQAPEALEKTASGPGIGLGVENTQIQRQFMQGALETTGNPLDLAIQGEGFLQVIRPDGSIGYCRDGSLKVDGNGLICTAQGYPLSPGIEIPDDAKDISIGPDGTVSVKRPMDTAPRAIGQIELARFINPGGLESLGGNLFAATEVAGEPIVNTPGQEGLGTLGQGMLERSNVNLVQEMVDMIMAQRAYEINTKSIQASDDMLRMTNNLRRA
jgi:flagellar basal-body rod protein FlgG